MENFLASLEIVQTIFVFIYLFNALFRRPLQAARHCMITAAFVFIMELVTWVLGGTVSVLIVIFYPLLFIMDMVRYNRLKRRIR